MEYPMGMSAPPTNQSLHNAYGGPPQGPPMAPPGMGGYSAPATAPGSLQSLGGMGGPPMDSHMGQPMHGYGPEMGYAQPEIRHAPHTNRPEHKEMPEHQKVVNRVQFASSPDGEQLPSGSEKFALYGALEDIARKEMFDQTEALKRRRRINCVPALNALFLPWVLLLTVFSMASFYIHYAAPFSVFVFNSTCLVCSVVYAYKSFTDTRTPPMAAFYPKYLSVNFLAAVVFGWLLGDLNFWFNMQPCFNIEHLATYTNVNPSTQTLSSGQVIPSRGKRYQDAGKVYFNSNAKIDTTKSMSFKMGDLYCVAPIVDPDCKKNCGYDFWAVGINCCAEDVADFRCGEYANPSAKSGLRLMHDELRPNYRLAVLEAEGVHKIVSTHPIFVEWLHDPIKELKHMKSVGFRGFVLLMIVSFLGYGVAAYFSLQWARTKFANK